MKQNNLKHQALLTLVGDHDSLWTDWLNSAVASRERAQAEYEILNNLDVLPGELPDRWYNYLWGLGVDEQWLVFWKSTLSPTNFRDVALVTGLATLMSSR